MTNTISGKKIEALRRKRGWSQVELAEMLGCSKDQVSRWERGVTKRVNSLYRDKLLKTFRVDWEALTQPSEEEKPTVYETVQLNVRVPRFARNALELVCLRYNLAPGDVIGLAPLLFLITAEHSLHSRKEGVDSIERSVENLAITFQEYSLSCGDVWGDIQATTEEALEEDKRSIETRDVFGRRLSIHNGHCPYTGYLKEMAGNLLVEKSCIGKLEPTPGSIPFYEIALDTLEDKTAIDLCDDKNDKFTACILHGDIDLKEVLAQKDALTPEQFREWRDLRVAEATAEEARKQEPLARAGGQTDAV